MQRAAGWVVWLSLVVLVSIATTTFAMPEVKVEALFKDAAVLRIDGQQVMLKSGKAHTSGITLVSANAKGAVVEFDGKQQSLALHMAIGGAFEAPAISQVVVRKNDLNQYKVAGSINGLTVQFLVDTGANTVAMNEMDARRLGLQYKLNGEEIQVVTASGVTRSWAVLLSSVKVGEIVVRNVDAVVIEGGFPQEVLLGMSYLEHVKIQEHNSVLRLERDF